MDELLKLARVIGSSKPHRPVVRAVRWHWEWECNCGAKGNRTYPTNAAAGKAAAWHARRGK
ncbi:hypothetical protein [Streptomyces malaysiensis]|uniref:hypothetical protein n=1 Tax=Streptomyces malaysiensis TaxID=92644 RepID=UPI003419A6DA